MSVKNKLEYFLSCAKSLAFCLRMFPFHIAIKMPVLIHYRTRVKVGNGKIVLPQLEDIKFGLIRLGFGGTPSVCENRYNILLLEDGKMIFWGSAHCGGGYSIRNSGTLIFGSNFSANKNFKVTCAENIEFGNDVLFGWNCAVRDSDGHTIIKSGCEKPVRRKVIIGNHVWVCAESHILKGSKIQDECVIGYRSVVSGRFSEKNVTIAGSPARIVQKDINWKY